MDAASSLVPFPLMKRLRAALGVLAAIPIILFLLIVGMIRMAFGRGGTAAERPEGYGERPLQDPPALEAVLARIAVFKLRFRHIGSSPPAPVLDDATRDWSAERRAEFDKEVEERHRAVLAALNQPSVSAEMEESERDMLEQRPTELSFHDFLQSSWVAESLGCMLWAVGRIGGLPPWDTQFDPETLQPFVMESDEATAAGMRLRPIEELRKAREAAELWHWRSRTRYLTERGDKVPAGLPFDSYDAIARMTAKAAVERGMLASTIGDDFPALGKPYRDLTADEWSLVTSIAMERHRALNWLCGYAPANRWDETPTST